MSAPTFVTGARSRAPGLPLLRRQAAPDRRDGQRDARSCAGAASGHPHLPAPRYGCRACGTIHQAPAPERPIAKGLASPALLAHVLIAKYCDHLTGKAKSSPGRASRSTARPWRTGWAALAGGWSRCRPASQPVCLDQPSCLPTTRRSRCSIPAAATPKTAGCGSMHVTIDPGPDPNHRPPSTSTVLIARQSVPRPISRTSAGCWKSTAMPASSG
jgi:hypothetical protein